MESTTQGGSQLVRSSQGVGSCSGTPPHSARRSPDWTSNLLVTSQPALPPELLSPTSVPHLWCLIRLCILFYFLFLLWLCDCVNYIIPLSKNWITYRTDLYTPWNGCPTQLRHHIVPSHDIAGISVCMSWPHRFALSFVSPWASSPSYTVACLPVGLRNSI